MISKMDVRKYIDNTKEEYSKTGDKSLIVKASILKGLYIALDGKKGIPLPSKYRTIVNYSKIIFKYKLKLSNVDKAYEYLFDSLMKIDKIPEYYCDFMPTSSRGIAKLLAELVCSDYHDDLIINYNTIYNNTISILTEMER